MSENSSNHTDNILGRGSKDRTKIAVRELAKAVKSQKKKENDFNIRYGQEQSGKVTRYAEEDTIYSKFKDKGVVFDSGLFGHKVRYDEQNPDVMIRSKKRWSPLRGTTTTDKYVPPLPPGADGNPGRYVSKIVEKNSRKLIVSDYSTEGTLLKKSQSLSHGRRVAEWNLDTHGRLIRTKYKTDRLKDGVIFSPRSETIGNLENGIRKVVQKKGWRTNSFDRDEATGFWTHTGKKGLIREKNVEFNADGSMATKSSRTGKLFGKKIEYRGDVKYETISRLFRNDKFRTLELTDKEKALQRALRETKQRSQENTHSRTDTSVEPQDNDRVPSPLPSPSVTPQPKTDVERTFSTPTPTPRVDVTTGRPHEASQRTDTSVGPQNDDKPSSLPKLNITQQPETYFEGTVSTPPPTPRVGGVIIRRHEASHQLAWPGQVQDHSTKQTSPIPRLGNKQTAGVSEADQTVDPWKPARNAPHSANGNTPTSPPTTSPAITPSPQKTSEQKALDAFFEAPRFQPQHSQPTPIVAASGSRFAKLSTSTPAFSTKDAVTGSRQQPERTGDRDRSSERSK